MKLVLSAIFVLLATVAAFSQGEPKKYANSDEVPRITLDEAKAAFDKGTAIFIDARAAEAYKDGHIKGAISVPIGSTDDFSTLPKGKTIIVYCS